MGSRPGRPRGGGGPWSKAAGVLLRDTGRRPRVPSLLGPAPALSENTAQALPSMTNTEVERFAVSVRCFLSFASVC